MYNIAIITRTNTERMPGFRYGRAFSKLGHNVQYIDFSENSLLLPVDFVLFEDNADYHIYPKIANIPCFYLAIDTMVEHGHRCKQQSKNMDHIFYAQHRDKNKFGVNSTWLPNAHDDSIVTVTPEWTKRSIEISSVGDFDRIYGDRLNIKRLILQNFHTAVIKNNLSLKEMADLYSNSKFVANYNTYKAEPKEKDLNLRTFECTGYGAVMLIHKDTELNGLSELGFLPYQHYIPYTTDDHLIEELKHCLKLNKFMSIISKAGKELVENHHTYIHRAKKIIEVFETTFK